jgi:DNA-binding CsgD family transcriptional regulator
MSAVRRYREESAGGDPGSRWLEAVAALDWAYTDGTADSCVARIHEVLADGQLMTSDPGFLAIASLIVIILADAPESLDLWEAVLAEAHSKGSLFAISGTRSWLSFAMMRRGDLLDSYRVSEDAMSQFASYGYASEVYSYSAGFRVFTLVERGMYEEADRVLFEHGRPHVVADGTRYWRAGEMELLLATGRYEDLIAAADSFDADYSDYYVNPAVGPWRSLKALALHALGRTDEGVELAEAELVQARHWGAPGTLGRTLRTLGVLRGKEGIAALEESVALLETSTSRLEHAKSVAALGTALAGTRKAQARELLGRAYELARICGADPLSDEVAAWLRKVEGASLIKAPTGAASLTRLERRVAELAADGSTDREIAQALYLTPAVITAQVAEAHRKLGVETREQLAVALAT